MALKRPRWPQGRIVTLEFDSNILKASIPKTLGDPHKRLLTVWLPPQYDRHLSQRFPVLYDLVGFTGSGLSHVNWRGFDENVPERAGHFGIVVDQKYGC